MNFIYPQFRKLLNEKSYYKIDSETHFTELQRTGKMWTQTEIEARILPERNLVRDLLEASGKHYQVISEDDYITFREMCEKTLYRY